MLAGFTQADVIAGASHGCAVTTGGVAYCWGATRSRGADGPLPAGGGQLGDGRNTDSNVPVAVAGGLAFQSMSADVYHSCGVTTAEVAYCWGLNNLGQLGDGTNTASSVPVLVDLIFDP